MKKNLLYDELLIKRKPPVNFHEIKNADKFIRLEEHIEPCYLCELNQAYVSPYGMVFKNGQVIKESVYSMFVHNNNALTFYKKILLNKVKKVSGDCLVAHNAYFDNYYHWTLEALPRIFSVKEHASNLKLLIHEKLTPFIEAYLAFFDFKDIIKIKDDELVLAEKLWLPMHTASGLTHRESLIREMAYFIKSKTPYNGNDYKDYEKIYLSRDKARYRRLVNEHVFMDSLNSYGFKKVNFEELDLVNQINLMRNVKKFIGVHGAGFSNIMYMNSPETTINIISKDHQDPAFYNLACAFNMKYLWLGCERMGIVKYCGNDDIRVDVSHLENILFSQDIL